MTALGLHRASVLQSGAAAGGGGGDFLTFTDSEGLQQTTSTYTFSAMALGAADANRHIVVAVAHYGGTTNTVTAVTVGGVSASIASDGTTSASSGGQGNADQYHWIAAVPTGTTGDVVVTTSADSLAVGIGVFRLDNPNTTAVDVNVATGSDTTLDVDTVSGGGVIGSWQSNDDAGTTWTGLTEQYEAEIRSNSGTWHSGAMANDVSAETPRTVSASGTETTHRACVASSWQPA